MSPARLAFLSPLIFAIPALATTPAYVSITLSPTSSYARAIGGGQVGGEIGSTPTLWTTFSPDSAIPLTTGVGGFVNAVDGTHQAGCIKPAPGLQHATLWSGSAQSALNLNPPGYFTSTITSMFLDAQAGWATTPDGHYHAFLWHGSPESAVDLNPAGYLDSGINGISADYLVGHGTPDVPGAVSHALLWNRSTGQITDFGVGTCTAVSGAQITGIQRDFAGDSHPLLWNKFGSSYIDLDHGPINGPLGVLDTNGATQVGYFIGIYGHAVAWTSTRDSIVNLDQFIPGYHPFYDQYIQSSAEAIDAQGRIAGSYDDHATLWIPSSLLPDPTIVTPALLFLSSLTRRRFRRHTSSHV